jgi:predicted HTH transcriptional regulator
VRHDDILLKLGYERKDLDYKETVDLVEKSGRASLAKDIIAMSNAGGGTIVIGVEEPASGKFNLRGLSNGELNKLETTKICNSIQNYVDPMVNITVRRVEYDEKLFVFIEVPDVVDTIVLAKKQNKEAGLYLGRIYARNAAAESAEVLRSDAIREIIDRLCCIKHGVNDKIKCDFGEVLK